ncbi:hypothetical protein [Thalassobellus suaedae]|uniref:Uncharacterized protein n=1 Tax=Thalassobellus suaedae TaxID=3074124 RepID=A0ABY9Y3I3_9FLAO|nr:hypothetical protein RHP49_16135 [Flavobacteriaceae bacterium HL-DH10]
MLNRNADYWLNHLSNKLLFILLKEKSKYWFSIEDTFYRHINEIYNKMQSANYELKNLTPTLDKLNNDFNEIKSLLKEYLLTINIEKNRSVELFFRKFNEGNNLLNGELHIINFNYTGTIKNTTYLKKHYTCITQFTVL